MSNTIIIAEAGVNHNGDIVLAKELIDAAAEAGVDYVKFQTFKADKIVSPYAEKADYQSRNSDDNETMQYQMLQKLELSDNDHFELLEHCKNSGLKFLSSAFDIDGLDFLESLDLDFYKIPSGEITNLPYLRKVSSKRKPVILSTGLSNLREIENAVNVLSPSDANRKDIIILHCNTAYPTRMEHVNLKAMIEIKKELGVEVGYSDHTLGYEVSIAAVAYGAKVIEKHFTIDNQLSGPDHKASLEPEELSKMVKSIRNVELAISGHGKKEPSAGEENNSVAARKSIHLRKNINNGSYIKEEDIISLRPGDGISPMLWDEIVGKKANKNLSKNHKLELTDFE